MSKKNVVSRPLKNSYHQRLLGFKKDSAQTELFINS
jgi:hypothetical protein